MPTPPFPGFYQLLLVLLGFASCAGGAPWMMQGRTKLRQNFGGTLFITGTIFIGVAVLLGKAGLG